MTERSVFVSAERSAYKYARNSTLHVIRSTLLNTFALAVTPTTFLCVATYYTYWKG